MSIKNNVIYDKKKFQFFFRKRKLFFFSKSKNEIFELRQLKRYLKIIFINGKMLARENFKKEKGLTWFETFRGVIIWQNLQTFSTPFFLATRMCHNLIIGKTWFLKGVPMDGSRKCRPFFKKNSCIPNLTNRKNKSSQDFCVSSVLKVFKNIDLKVWRFLWENKIMRF